MDKRYMALATSMLVLKLLDRQSMYGYQIIRELEQQSQNVFRLQAPSILSFTRWSSRARSPRPGSWRTTAESANTMPSQPTAGNC